MTGSPTFVRFTTGAIPKKVRGGYPLKKKHRYPLDRVRRHRIRLRILLGHKFSEIARDEQVSVSYISKVRYQEGIPRKIKPR